METSACKTPKPPRSVIAVSPEDGDDLFWFELIRQEAAAEFAGLKPRGLEAMRQRGDGPKFVRVSSRCIRYRRIDLREWSESLLRKSTSDPGPKATE